MTADQLSELGQKAHGHPRCADCHFSVLLWRTGIADRPYRLAAEPADAEDIIAFLIWVQLKLSSALAADLEGAADPAACIASFWARHGASRELLRDGVEANNELKSMPRLSFEPFITKVERMGLDPRGGDADVLRASMGLGWWLPRFAQLAKRFFLSDAGYFGLAPVRAEPTDEVWVLQGGSVPFVLRPLRSGNRQLVGEAYVHGVMKGEIVPDGINHRLEDVIIQRQCAAAEVHCLTRTQCVGTVVAADPGVGPCGMYCICKLTRYTMTEYND